MLNCFRPSDFSVAWTVWHYRCEDGYTVSFCYFFCVVHLWTLHLIFSSDFEIKNFHKQYKALVLSWFCRWVQSPSDVIQSFGRAANNTHTTKQKRTNNGFRNTRKHAKFLLPAFGLYRYCSVSELAFHVHCNFDLCWVVTSIKWTWSPSLDFQFVCITSRLN